MSKKQPQRLFSIFSVAYLSMLLSAFAMPLQHNNMDHCNVIAGGKAIPLFSRLPEIRKILLVSRDIEYQDTKMFAYGYEEKISQAGRYKLTPQLIFFVDTSTMKTAKQSVNFIIETAVKGAPLTKSDIEQSLKVIKRSTVPFLQLPVHPNFDSQYTFASQCSTTTVIISKVKKAGALNQEFNITILIDPA